MKSLAWKPCVFGCFLLFSQTRTSVFCGKQVIFVCIYDDLPHHHPPQRDMTCTAKHSSMKAVCFFFQALQKWIYGDVSYLALSMTISPKKK